MTSLASREMTEQEMVNTCTAPQMAHLIQVLRQTIRNKDKEIERWVDMVSQLQRDGELDPPEPQPEPKPLLADAQVGDLCKRRDGKWVQVDSYSNDRPCPVMCKSDIGGQDCFTLDGRNHNAINDSKDIIATEPLAPEGSAEWAWQMLILQKPVSHPAEGIWLDTYYTKDGFVRCMAKTGWQLYEPEPAKEPKLPKEPDYIICKGCGGSQSVPSPEVSSTAYTTCPKCGGTGYEPEPAFKAGDWVTDGAVQGRVVTRTSDTTWVEVQDGKQYHIETSHLRKLDPSEVNVKVTLEGTVSQDSILDKASCFSLHTDRSEHIISLSEIEDSELVESLLKAQEGE